MGNKYTLLRITDTPYADEHVLMKCSISDPYHNYAEYIPAVYVTIQKGCYEHPEDWICRPGCVAPSLELMLGVPRQGAHRDVLASKLYYLYVFNRIPELRTVPTELSAVVPGPLQSYLWWGDRAGVRYIPAKCRVPEYAREIEYLPGR